MTMYQECLVTRMNQAPRYLILRTMVGESLNSNRTVARVSVNVENARRNLRRTNDPKHLAPGPLPESSSLT